MPIGYFDVPCLHPLSFVHSNSHAFRWSTTNHSSLEFFTTRTGRSLFLSGGNHLFFLTKKKENQQIVVYGNPTPSDLLFMDSALFSFPASKASSTLSSTVSDAESAPPELVIS